MPNQKENLMDDVANLCKRRGFVFPSSEIYGGVGGFWDYGPLGVLLKNNIKSLWWKRFVQGREDVVGIEGSIIMNPEVWKASGHIESFTDPLIECKECHTRFRSDHMQDGRFIGIGKAVKKNQCPECGKFKFTEPRNFNMMFKTYIGPVENSSSLAYLRPVTAQSMFTNFKQIQEVNRRKIPFGIAQIGKSFRNEITFGNFSFRSREFEIAEIEYFVKPGTDEKWFEHWLSEWKKFILDVGLDKNMIRLYDHPKKSLAHYSKRTTDIKYKFPFGWSELTGLANRTDYDLIKHSKHSGKDLSYFDEESKKRFIPYVIEPTLGVERLVLAILVNAYEKISKNSKLTRLALDESRRKNQNLDKIIKTREEGEIVLHLNPKIAPIKIAVLPLVKKDKKLITIAKNIHNQLKIKWFIQYDEVGSIGKRYRRQDEIGTPFCLTVDFYSLKNNSVTVRHRDSMKQERIKIDKLSEYFSEILD